MRLHRHLAATRFALLAAVLLATMLSGCRGPSVIDEECIKGRLSPQQAAEINQGPWGHLPSYNNNGEGQCRDCAQEGDRVLSAKCSNFVKRL